MNKDTYYLNEAQARVILIDPKIFVIIAGRRLGKSSEIIAHPLSNRVFDMPGSSWLLLGRTYKQILERTLPATKTAGPNGDIMRIPIMSSARNRPRIGRAPRSSRPIGGIR